MIGQHELLRAISMEKPKIIWVNVLLFAITGLVAIIGVPAYAYFNGFDIYHLIATVLCIGFCGMSITAGYHRLWSHHAYQTNAVIRVIYAIGGAFALQNSALHWSSDHRVHHKHVDDNDRDPYSAKRGFFFSHIGWMLRDYQGDKYADYSNVPDLKRDKVVMWQHRHYLKLAIVTNFGIPLALGFLHGDVLGMALTAGFLRLVISHHVTFFINSLAHVWGRQPYSDESTARDNGIIAYLTFGEGYHNYHHSFQFDYRNGIKWWQFDPTKWLIWSLDKLGLAHNLRQVSSDRIEKAEAQMSLKKAQEKVRLLPNTEELKAELKAKLQAEYDALVEKINETYAAQKAWLEIKKNKLIENCEKSESMARYQELKASLQEHQNQWRQLVAQYA